MGASLVNRLLENPDYEVTVVDNLVTGSLDKLPLKSAANVRFIKADVNDWRDISGVFTSCSYDYVFHYAALVGVQRTLANPKGVLDDIKGIQNVLDLAKTTFVKRVFFSSSSEVYGEPVEIPQREYSTPLNSRLPYAVVKNVGESFCRSYYQEFGLEYTIFRLFNTYGPLQSEDFVVSKFVRAALAGEDLIVYGDGSQTRTFCYIDDNVSTVIKILENGLCRNEVINIGSDVEISIRKLAELVIERLGSSSKIVHVDPLKEGDMTRRKPDNTKMREILGRELVPLSEGIEKTAQACCAPGRKPT